MIGGGNTPSVDEKTFITVVARVVGALNRGGVPFALAGGAAVYAHGGPHSRHDVDVLVTPADAERAVSVLTASGMSAVRPPEDWLLKVYDGEVLVDVIHRVSDVIVTAQTIADAERIRVGSVFAGVIGATELMVQKLLVLDCHHCDFAELLLVAKILREKIDWPELRQRTRRSPFASAFCQLLRELSVIDADETAGFIDTVAHEALGPETSPEYLAAQVRRALAEDSQVAELGIAVHIDYDATYLTGSVNCRQRRAEVEALVRRIVGPVRIVNDIEVVQLAEPVAQVAR